VAFTVGDFEDLRKLLEQRPEWQAELRRLILSDDFLALPGIVRDLAEAQRRTEDALRELADVQRQTETRLGSVETRLGRVEDRLAEMIVEQQWARDQLGGLRGSDLERRYRENAGAMFDDLVRRPVLVAKHQVADLLDGESGEPFSRTERREVLDADLIVRGRRWDDGQEVYLVVEVSVGIGREDVERAARRSALLGRIRPSMPVVAGERLVPEAAQSAVVHNVWVLLGGRAIEPSAR
jgi:hypothetical protein